MQKTDIMDATPLYVLYTRKSEFLGLRTGDQKFFKKLFPLLLFLPSNEFNHKFLSVACSEDGKPIPESTLQKRLKRLRDAKLIIKWEEKERVNGKWTTLHSYIELEPKTFAFARAKQVQEQIDLARKEALEDSGVYLEKQIIDDMRVTVEKNVNVFEEEEPLEERIKRLFNHE